jgi:hypothetical protein
MRINSLVFLIIKFLSYPLMCILRLIHSVLVVLYQRIFRIPLLLLLSTAIVMTPLYIYSYYYGKTVIYEQEHIRKYFIIYLPVFVIVFLFLLKRFPGPRDFADENDGKLSKGLSLRKSQKVDNFVFHTAQSRKFIVLSSPFQGIYIEGSAGSGKSQSIIEPLIYQSVEHGFSGFLYDFKGYPPVLSSILYGALTEYKPGVSFAHINFVDPAISHRCNPLSVEYLPSKIYAHSYASVILKNLNRSWAIETDFWAESAIAYLSAIIWYLKKHHPSLCTLPHATLLALEEPSKSLKLLEQDEEIKYMISAIVVAYNQQADKQLAGIFSSLQLPLNKLYTKEVFWLLSSHRGDETHIQLDVSNSVNPTYLSVGNDPGLGSTLAPVIALLATVCMYQMNQPCKHKSLFILDEAPTLFIPGLEQLPATARSNSVSTVLCVQDFAQLSQLYGTKLAEVLRNNLGNQFFGMTGSLTTSEYVSKMAGEYMGVRWSYTDSSNDSSDTASLDKTPYIKAHQVASQPPGHFIIKVGGNSPQFYSTQLKAPFPLSRPIPELITRSKLAKLMEDQWGKIHNEVKNILKG